MGRRNRHPSGPAIAIPMRISPEHLTLLDRQRGTLSRRAHIEALLERTETQRADDKELRAATRRITRALTQRRCTHYRDGTHILMTNGTCKGCGVRLE